MINFTTNLLTTSNPAYNDSIIRYNSTITGMTVSQLYVAGITTPFTIYPINNSFTFNFKEIAKTLINTSGFTDNLEVDVVAQFINDDTSLQKTIQAAIITSNAVTADTTTVTYKFHKGVEQLPLYHQKLENTSLSGVTVLLPSTNNFDYSVTYFDGFPFDFAVRGIKFGDVFYFRNSNSGIESDSYTATTNQTKRIYLSDGANNITISNVLPLSTNHNLVELWVNGQVKANITIRKIESKCGVYLKWFNQNGSYSYWLFDKFFKETLKTKSLADISGGYDNLQNLKSTSESLGKTATGLQQITTNYSTDEKEYLIDINKSPKVEMYIHQTPFNQTSKFKFIGLQINDADVTYNNKNTNNKLKLTVELPSINTITY